MTNKIIYEMKIMLDKTAEIVYNVSGRSGRKSYVWFGRFF